MESKKILIATKTYPSISQKYQETVCTAGVVLDDLDRPLQWIRIYPIRYRKLDFEKQYRRWSIITANVEKNDKDSRIESYRIDDSSIRIIREIDTKNNWHERKSLVLSLKSKSIEEIKIQDKSLGIIKPQKIIKYYVEKTDREWHPKQQAVLDQTDLFDPPAELEKIPYKFGYQFIDEGGIKHKYSISDWEISELYRKCKNQSKMPTIDQQEKEALEKVRIKLEEVFLRQKDLYFIVGNLKDHRQSFMIIGIFYPPIIMNEQLTLF